MNQGCPGSSSVTFCSWEIKPCVHPSYHYNGSITYFASSTSTDSATMVMGYKKFLQSLALDQKYDHLHLPLQTSTQLTPIVLLTGTLIHQLQNYCQWYRVMLVCAVFYWISTIISKGFIFASSVFKIPSDSMSKVSCCPRVCDLESYLQHCAWRDWHICSCAGYRWCYSSDPGEYSTGG